MNPLVADLYKRLTRPMPDKKSYCACCELSANRVEEGLIRHLKDCQLAKLYESEGGKVEWSAR